ncbi:peptidase S1 and S6 chymotrypsin/Hap [Thiorhodococcus drewsii AZ1]|uniref:Peptidase S1 and S6 chymotrypsin/Hap n=1 Tax=Thiorhodococcus drewsii AZ1 TaxID=765913 RepID=G2E2A9_9GAMM|nr:serine protease [Thiorhodococcus drewsii]EGV30825.1 peptidase S1 and S6 chymotrypsin/Hap [Thiorhodococcus drewsii AZ1]
MLQGTSQKFRGGCLMLVRDTEGAVGFLGTAFLVHGSGYLLTAAHLVSKPEGLLVVATASGDEYQPMTFDRVSAIPVSVVQQDIAHDVALLKMEQDISIGVPDDFLGSGANVRSGASLMSLGYSFGHEQLHTALSVSSFASAKIRSPNDTQLILFDTMVQDGDTGGPLIHVTDGHIVGIVSGRFEPAEVVRGSADWERRPARDTNISYAVDIDYGVALMRAEGLFENA